MARWGCHRKSAWWTPRAPAERSPEISTGTERSNCDEECKKRLRHCSVRLR